MQNGTGTDKNMDKWAAAWYRESMPHRRQFLLSLLLLLGMGSADARQNGNLSQWDVEGMYVQARAMLEDRSIQNVETVPLLLETCTREGHPEAARLLLDVYEGKFKGLEATPAQAARLARELAKARQLDQQTPGGSDIRTEAMYRLAMYLEKGIGCTASKKEAYEWMQRAARRGMPQAKVEEARYLMRGIGVKANPRLAWELLHSQARENPDTPHLYFYMGYMCAQGIGMPRNARKAFELFRMGAIRNDARCLNNLGAMFEYGYPTPRNTENALRLYRKAANQGNREASANMQRLAFKEGIRAQVRSSTPPARRIDNAALRVIHALPVSEYTRDRLRSWLTPSLEQDEL